MLYLLLALACLRPGAEPQAAAEGGEPPSYAAPVPRPEPPAGVLYGHGMGISETCTQACIARREAEGISRANARGPCLESCSGDPFLIRRGDDMRMRTGTRVAVEGRLARTAGRDAPQDGYAVELEDGERVWLKEGRLVREARPLLGEEVRVVGTFHEGRPPRGDNTRAEPPHLVDWEPPVRLRRPSLLDDELDTGDAW